METLILEGEALTYSEYVEDFLRGARMLLEAQRQASSFQCSILKDVHEDEELAALIEKYSSR